MYICHQDNCMIQPVFSNLYRIIQDIMLRALTQDLKFRLIIILAAFAATPCVVCLYACLFAARKMLHQSHHMQHFPSPQLPLPITSTTCTLAESINIYQTPSLHKRNSRQFRKLQETSARSDVQCDALPDREGFQQLSRNT